MEHLAGAEAGTVAAALQWLEASRFGETARRSLWLYPLASVLHIFGVALLLGAIAVYDLRVLGAVRALPLRAAGRLMLPVAVTGFVLQVLSGSVMLAADATHVAANPVFRVKLVLIGLALLNVVLVRLRSGAGGRRLGEGPEAPGWARLGAVISLLVWLLVAAAGRLIAYA